jgi:enterobactin synthetase component D
MCGAACIALQCPDAAQFTFKPVQFPDSYLNCLRGSVSEEDCVRINHELAFGVEKEKGKSARVNVFMGGRLALRRALQEAEATALSICEGSNQALALGALLSTAHGGPSVPPGYTGSISHKDSVAVAAALKVGGETGNVGFVGVDIEKRTNAAHEKLLKRLFTATEQADITVASSSGALTNTVEEDVMLRFSFKEAVYKAVHPYVQRYVEFKEVEVFPRSDGTAKVNFLLSTGEQFDYRAEWRRFGERYWITCVHAWTRT